MGKGRAPFYDVLDVIQGLDPEVPVRYKQVAYPIWDDRYRDLRFRNIGAIAIVGERQPEGPFTNRQHEEETRLAWAQRENRKIVRICRSLMDTGYDVGPDIRDHVVTSYLHDPHRQWLVHRFEGVGKRELVNVVRGRRRVVASFDLADWLRIGFDLNSGGRISLNPLQNLTL